MSAAPVAALAALLVFAALWELAGSGGERIGDAVGRTIAGFTGDAPARSRRRRCAWGSPSASSAPASPSVSRCPR
jgi:hypothetical protein